MADGSDERLIVQPVPQNIGEEWSIMGIPIREIGLFFLGPLGLSAVLKTLEVDPTLPFPFFGGVLLSNVVAWVLGPASFYFLWKWKRKNPDVSVEDALRHYFGPRSFSAGAPDVEAAPYLIDPPPIFGPNDYRPPMRAA